MSRRERVTTAMVVAAKIDREIKKLKKKTAHTHKPPRERERKFRMNWD